MKFIGFSRLFLVSLGTLGTACSSAGSAPVPIGSLESAFGEAACDYFAACPLPGVASSTFAVLADNPGSSGTCADLLVGTFGGFGPYEAAVDRGTVIYDGAAASRCLAALSSTCVPPEALLAVEPECLEVFTGTVEPGGPCVLDEECTGDARCVPATEGACAGTCVARLGLGVSCADDSECSAELGGTMECTTTTENPEAHCVLTRYVAAGAGDPCGEVDVDGDERVRAHCGAGLFCKIELEDTTGTCSNPLPIGAPCTLADACVAGAECGGEFDPKCTAITLVDEPGVECDFESLVYCNPLDRLVCGESVCEVIGDGTQGARCRPAFPNFCNAGLYCDPDPAEGPKCQPLVGVGEPCGIAGNASCATEYCDEVTDPLNPVCAQPLCF